MTDKVVLVNGGSQGVGAAIARAAAARRGATVAVTGRRIGAGRRSRPTAAEGARRPIRTGRHRRPRAGQGSVTRTVADRSAGSTDWCNAAGLTTRGTLLDTTPELFDPHIAVNLRGPFFAMQAAVADMVAREAPGTIVNIISSSAHGGQPYLAPYVAAKAGLAGLTRNAAHAHRWDRIRINGLNIGWTETEGEDAIQRAFHGAGDDWRERGGADACRWASSARSTRSPTSSCFLLSDRSGVVTGSVIDWDQIVLGGLD